MTEKSGQGAAADSENLKSATTNSRDKGTLAKPRKPRLIFGADPHPDYEIGQIIPYVRTRGEAQLLRIIAVSRSQRSLPAR